MSFDYQKYLKKIKKDINEVSVKEANELVNNHKAILVDVREQNEWDESYIKGAKHIPRGYLEQRIGRVASSVSEVSPGGEKNKKIILYCATGNRSAIAANSVIKELGYDKDNILSLQGGITAWKNAGLETETPFQFNNEQRIRYSRHMLLPEVGPEGQEKLLKSKVLVLGSGGLGAPVLMYLAAAGVGTIGVIDDDIVDMSNLQRQVIHTQDNVGKEKVLSAKEFINNLNPDVRVNTYSTRLNNDNIIEVITGYNVIVDAVDNFPTRYLLNDASVRLNIPVVSASILAFDGQVTVYKPFDGPCYRCVFPESPPAELAPNCGETGVLGVLPGVMGLLEATEVIKLILGIGTPLIGKLLTYDALDQDFIKLNVHRDKNCPICSRNPKSITDDEMGVFEDYEAFCAV